MEDKTNNLIKQFIEREKNLRILRWKEVVEREKGDKRENEIKKKGDKENN